MSSMFPVISFEEIKARAAAAAAAKCVPPQEAILVAQIATLARIHGLGYQRVDFSGGRRAAPDDGTVPLTTHAS